MKRDVLLLSALLLTSSAWADQPNPQVKEAQAAIKGLFDQLKDELGKAMKAGGPPNAVGVCNDRAPEIAKNTNAANRAKVSRVSLKNRNPNNAPNNWQKAVLLKFEARKQAGEDVAKMDYSEVVGDEFRYMKAIPTDMVCLQCHGSNIDPKVTAKLDELYPEDKARGYGMGDIRGAFYVTIPK